MRYRIIKNGDGFLTQVSWLGLFWSSLFQPGFNYFKTAEEAETAIRRDAALKRTDNIVVREFDNNGIPCDTRIP